jgi:FAD/FMN-containing dehydrogenase
MDRPSWTRSEKLLSAFMYGLNINLSRPTRPYDKEGTYRDLLSALGPEKVSNSLPVRAVYCRNISTTTAEPIGIPDMVVTPETQEEVQTIVKVANIYKAPVTVQGSGTGFPLTICYMGGILIDTIRMRKILEINTVADYAVIEPGVTYAEFNAVLREQGYSFPCGCFPPSTSVVANCFGTHGIDRTILYPFNALSAQIVLGNGEILILGSDTTPDWTQGSPCGPDFLHLFKRSVGTLGIVTRCAVRIFRELETKKCLIYGFSSFADQVDFNLEAMRNWLCQNVFCALWTWPVHQFHRQRMTNKLPEDTNRRYPTIKPPEGTPYNFSFNTIEGFKEDVKNRERILDRLAIRHNGYRISEEEIEKKWPWINQYVKLHFVEDYPIFLEPYVTSQGSNYPVYCIVQGAEVAKAAEKYIVETAHQFEKEHPQWTFNPGYFVLPLDNGRRWFINLLSWPEDYTEDPQEWQNMRSETIMTVMSKMLPDLVAKFNSQVGGLPLMMELIAAASIFSPDTHKLWKEVKKLLDPNDILCPYVMLGIIDKPDEVL